MLTRPCPLLTFAALRSQGALLSLAHKHSDNREAIAKLIVARLGSRIAMVQVLSSQHLPAFHGLRRPLHDLR